MSATDLSLRKFMRSNIAAVALWVAVVIPIGFLSGLGFSYLSGLLENIYAGIGFILLIAVLLVIFEVHLKKIFLRIRE